MSISPSLRLVGTRETTPVGRTTTLNVRPNLRIGGTTSRTNGTNGYTLPTGVLLPTSGKLAYDADRYEQLDHRTHVYQVSDTYIGSDEKVSRSTTLLDMNDIKNPKMEDGYITLPEGVERLFLEVLSNSGDNVIKSRLAGIEPGNIKITMDRKTIIVRNGGRIIPITIHQQTGVYVPEMILGMLLTSDNYGKNKNRTGAGRNGYGAKITNVYSHYFKVEIGDPQTGLSYLQEWRNNMTDRSDPIITEGYTGESFVQITYRMDQERFGYTEYPDEAFRLFARHAADMAFNHRVIIHFNQVILKFKDIVEFAKCRFNGNHKTLVHYEWPRGTPVITKQRGLILSTDPTVLPTVEVVLVDTPSEGKIISFTNAMINTDGGVHVDAVISAIQKPILSKINNAVNKSRRGKNGKSGPTLTATDLKRHISIIIAYRAINAKFRGQTKEKLMSPKPKITVAPERFNCIGRWNLVDRLIRALEAKQDRLLTKTDGRRKRHIDVPQSEDANWAGRGRKSAQCALVVTEGLSATTYAMKLFALSGPKYRNTYGFLPLRGKLLNPLGASKMQIAANKEIAAFKQLMGLKEGTDYTIPKDRASLRYGKIIIIADPDVDGKHILGLIINYLNYRFPSLLINEMVHYIKVPIIRVKSRGQENKFYNLAEFKTWQRGATPDFRKWNTRYFKGLGTSVDKEIVEDYNSLYSVQIMYDEYANKYLNLAFNPKNSNARKSLIERYAPEQAAGRFEKESISHIVNFEVVEFSVADVERSIPGFDGLKDSQRRILYAVLIKWGKKIGQKNLDQMKVARLGPYVATKTHYPHGEDSLNKAIIAMAQDYVGSNNLPHLSPEGDFGTRRKNGKDAAAPRYIHTKPMWWLRLIYRPEDDGILEMAMEEGKERGFKRLKPIIPPLSNGFNGIATGFSTFGPPYNPMDLCIWLISYMYKFELPYLVPWYRGFKGKVKVKASRGGKRISGKKGNRTVLVLDSDGQVISSDSSGDIFNQDSSESEESIEGMGEDDLEFDLGTRRCAVTKRESVFTQGVLIKGPKSVVVTELPIGRSIHGYDVWLRSLLSSGKISDFESHSQPNDPYFKITGMKCPSIKNLRLTRTFGLSNMVLLDDEDHPRYYKIVDDLMKTFYHYRLNAYRVRKELLIKTKRQELEKLSDRIRFIRAVVNKTLIVMRRLEADIYVDMDNLQLPQKLLKEVSLHQCTTNMIETLEKRIVKTKAELTRIIELEPVKMWEIELLIFIAAYLKHYPDEVTRFVYPSLQNSVLGQYYTPGIVPMRKVKKVVKQKPFVIFKVKPSPIENIA